MQLKKLYRAITALEQKFLGEQRDKDADDEGDRNPQTVGILVKGRPGPAGGLAGGVEVRGGEDETEKWKRLLVDHKELAEKVQNLLTLTLAPTVPASLRNIPTKYNLIARLWAHAFHRLLESFRQAASPPNNSLAALEYLQDFIYYAYTFYCALLEEHNLSDFRSGWVEALGDLSRYQMAYCALVEKQQTAASATLSSAPGPSPMALLTNPTGADSQINTPRPSSPDGGGNSDRAELRAPAAPEAHARIDDSPPPSPGPAARQLLDVPSVGLAAGRAMELVPEKEHWRQVARDWYAKGLAGTPGAGKLHHHIGLLCRERDGSSEELRGMYHFVKSMITVHPYSTSREAILQVWSPAAQTRRQGPDADVADLYTLLHGMLFTHIQMDDFRGVQDRFDEKLNIEGGAVVEERDWIMMAVVNLGAVLESSDCVQLRAPEAHARLDDSPATRS
ncbi:uncharacterized protein B0H18DRAFT_1126962 [Fomitopsis serialis]|uniref:uncharacterized protein n=1 Tax=Fomitopsis serialis TaxID=139415 RepID=UPI00200896E4|nr:uncharacterized protein B0H18DRAFT_1126962 [Neoantrodia serialis]KAH9912646.1 hypothetical protein B0H18DRAFT_1126962 [Neoantrodia serialis]